MQQLRYLSFAALLPSLCAQAIEVTPGDYEQLPADTTLGLIYYQHATTDNLYAQGKKVSSDFNLTSDVSILRLIHVLGLTETLTVDPQILLPFGRIDTGGDANTLGSATGTGDVILAAPVRLRLNESRDVIALTPYVYIPTGNYDKDDALNLGENRWKFDLQGAYVKHFSERWALDLVGDVIWYGDNDDYGSQSLRREQRVSYAAQVMGRYNIDSSTSLALGFGQTWGGENRIDGVDQNDRMKTTNLRVTAATFISPKDQLQLQLGRDLDVENGPRENFRLNLRYLHVF